jgi:tagatose 1,6-diphosphate aldolase
VLLSGGATPEKFERVLDYAYAAGAGGFLAGRTIWLDAVRRHFPDRNAVAVLERLSELTKASANPWTAHFPVVSDIKQEGDFARAY